MTPGHHSAGLREQRRLEAGHSLRRFAYDAAYDWSLADPRLPEPAARTRPCSRSYPIRRAARSGVTRLQPEPTGHSDGDKGARNGARGAADQAAECRRHHQ